MNYHKYARGEKCLKWDTLNCVISIVDRQKSKVAEGLDIPTKNSTWDKISLTLSTSGEENVSINHVIF